MLGIPTLNFFELEWTLISLVGLIVVLVRLREAQVDTTIQRESGRNGATLITAKMALRWSWIRVIILSSQLALGLLGAFLPDRPSLLVEALDPRYALWRLLYVFYAPLFTVVFNVDSILMTTDALLVLRDRAKLRRLYLARRSTDTGGEMLHTVDPHAQEVGVPPVLLTGWERLANMLVLVFFSRRVWLTVITCVGTVLMTDYGVKQDLWVSIDAVLLVLIGSYTYEDATGRKLGLVTLEAGLSTLIYSRKFWLAAIALTQMVALEYLGVQPLVWQSISGMLMSLAVQFAHDDVASMQGRVNEALRTDTLAVMLPPSSDGMRSAAEQV